VLRKQVRYGFAKEVLDGAILANVQHLELPTRFLGEVALNLHPVGAAAPCPFHRLRDGLRGRKLYRVGLLYGGRRKCGRVEGLAFPNRFAVAVPTQAPKAFYVTVAVSAPLRRPTAFHFLLALNPEEQAPSNQARSLIFSSKGANPLPFTPAGAFATNHPR
jgi:hypothetical protein